MIQIEESGMLFEFEEQKVYKVENSVLHKGLGNGVKTVEFIVSLKENDFAFVEAKSSSPRPTKENEEKFDEFIRDIADKFVHSFNMFLSAFLHRKSDEAISQSLLSMDSQQASFKFILIIKGHQIEWLQPLNDAFEKYLLYHQKIWNTKIILLNEELAREFKLVKA